MVARAGALDERLRSGRMPGVRPRADDVVSDGTGRALRASRQQLPTARRGRDARASRLGSKRRSIGRQRIAVGCPHHDVPGAVPAARVRAACSQDCCRGTQHGTAGDAAEQRLDGVERRRNASSSRAPAAEARRVMPDAQCSAPGLPPLSGLRAGSPCDFNISTTACRRRRVRTGRWSQAAVVCEATQGPATRGGTDWTSESRARARGGGVGGDRRRRAPRAGTGRSYSGSRVAGAAAAGVG